jgi:hypothetical protein
VINNIFLIFFWPQHEKDEIVVEFLDGTNNDALKRYECLFCVELEDANEVKMKSVESLDITHQKAAQSFAMFALSRKIQCFRPVSILHNTYVLCHLCALSVVKNSFRTIPVRSYANGLWIGDVPEEQCIAHNRATKCIYKLSIGPSGQMAARGNVCISPRDSS